VLIGERLLAVQVCVDVVRGIVVSVLMLLMLLMMIELMSLTKVVVVEDASTRLRGSSE